MRTGSHVWTPTYADLDKPETDSSELPIPKQARSPFSTDIGFRGNTSVHDNAKRPSVSPPRLSKRLGSRVWNPPYADLDKPETNPSEYPVPKRNRPSVSPPRLSTRPRNHVWALPFTDLDKPATNPSELPGPKRTRSPLSTDLGLRGHNSVHDDDAERELQAKAKRLARFRDEPEPSEAVSRNQKPQQVDVLGMDKRKFVAEVSDTTGYLRYSNLQIDGEDQVSSTVIIGYCLDMCPGFCNSRISNGLSSR